MLLTAGQREWFDQMRQEWFRVMTPFSGYGVSDIFPPLLIPPADRFAETRVLPSRLDLLRNLPREGVGAELGVQEGLFSKKLLEITSPDQLHLFEIDDAPLRKRNDKTLLNDPAVKFHIGDSSTLLSRFPENYFDWIYIDGDHSYEGVNKDIRVARTRVKPGGLLVFNDFTLWSPVECIDYGVAHAVCELSVDHNFSFSYFALHPHLYNDVALRRP